jgi:quercetin dioxygenase-like cupin family protein
VRGCDHAGFSVTVIDDASRDETASLARQAGADVVTLTGPRQGKTAALRHALASLPDATEWIIFLDGDGAPRRLAPLPRPQPSHRRHLWPREIKNRPLARRFQFRPLPAQVMNAGNLTTLFQSTTNAVGQPIAYPAAGTAEVTALLVEMAPGDKTPWHQHPVPLLGYLLAGELTVYQASGEKRTVRTGEVSLESVGVVHYGANEGAVPLKMIVFVTGVKDLPFTVFIEEPVLRPELPPS